MQGSEKQFLNSSTPPVPGMDSKFRLFPEPESALVFSRFPSPPAPLFPLPPALRSLGQFIYSSEGGAVLRLSQGRGANRKHSGAFQGTELITLLEKNFPKDPFRSQCCDCTFLGSCPVSLARCVSAVSPVLSARPSSPTRDWESHLQKEPGWTEVSFSRKPHSQTHINMQMSP